MRLEILYRAGHAHELLIVGLGNLNAMPLAQLHHDVEEVHAVQFQLLAERNVVFDVGQVFVGGEDFDRTFSDWSVDVGGRAGIDLGLVRRALSPVLGVGAVVWPGSQRVSAIGVEGTSELPATDMFVSLGLRWNSGADR